MRSFKPDTSGSRLSLSHNHHDEKVRRDGLGYFRYLVMTMNEHQELVEMIRFRASILRDLRGWFDDRGFLEVQPPCLSRECIIDLHIDPIQVPSSQFGLTLDLPEPFFLQTSPEAAMKRMLAGGAPSIYSLGPTFRSGERGAEHNVEFTMLEWYQRDADLSAGVKLLGDLACEILDRDGFDTVHYRDLFRERLGCDPIDADLAELQSHAAEHDPDLADSLAGNRDGLLEVLWSLNIQSTLGAPRPLIVANYPLSQAALAQVAKDDPQCAARFELFVDGVELANGYDELGDATVLRQRFQKANEQRKQIGKQPIAIPEEFLRAMEGGLPPCTGVALGVDRLLMVRTGHRNIEKVMPFPIELA